MSHKTYAFYDAQFGLFIRSEHNGYDFYEGEVLYRGAKVALHLRERDEIEVLREIATDVHGFIEKAKQFGARQLLDNAHRWGRDRSDDYVPITEEEFLQSWIPTDIVISHYDEKPEQKIDYTYAVWFDNATDQEVFEDHCICIHGQKSQGFYFAAIEG